MNLGIVKVIPLIRGIGKTRFTQAANNSVSPQVQLKEVIEELMQDVHIGYHVRNSRSLVTVHQQLKQGLMSTYARSLAEPLLRTDCRVTAMADILRKSGEMANSDYHQVVKNARRAHPQACA